MLERITEDKELIEALRYCVTDYNNIQSRLCNKCQYAKYADGKYGCENKLKADAADALEECMKRENALRSLIDGRSDPVSCNVDAILKGEYE